MIIFSPIQNIQLHLYQNIKKSTTYQKVALFYYILIELCHIQIHLYLMIVYTFQISYRILHYLCLKGYQNYLNQAFNELTTFSSCVVTALSF